MLLAGGHERDTDAGGASAGAGAADTADAAGDVEALGTIREDAVYTQQAQALGAADGGAAAGATDASRGGAGGSTPDGGAGLRRPSGSGQHSLAASASQQLAVGG